MNEQSNWKTIIISAIVTGIITLLTTFVINYISSKSSRLTYVTQTSIPFQKDSLNVRIFNLELMNDGEEVIEDINGQINFDEQKVTDYKLTYSPILIIKDSLNRNKYNISIASLNPTEKINISFLISSQNQIDSLTKVDFRAKGVLAKIKANDEKNEDKPFYGISFSVISFAVILSSLILTIFGKKIRKILYDRVNDEEEHSDDQNKILAYLCGIHGLTNEISRYLDQKIEVTYWSESDYFGNISALNRQAPENEKRLLVLIDLLNYAGITKESEGIILYNIAKIYNVLGDTSNCELNLNKAKGIIPKRINKRLLIDKHFI